MNRTGKTGSSETGSNETGSSETVSIPGHSMTSIWACLTGTSLISTDHVATNPGFAPIPGFPPIPDWYFNVCDRLFALSGKQDGWKGPDSRAALRPAFEHAGHFLWKLVLDGVKRRPVIGLDHEGTFSFCWVDGNSSIDLTVYQDGTYSYFATDGKQSMTSDNALVAGRISPRLLDLLWRDKQ